MQQSKAVLHYTKLSNASPNPMYCPILYITHGWSWAQTLCRNASSILTEPAGGGRFGATLLGCAAVTMAPGSGTAVRLMASASTTPMYTKLFSEIAFDTYQGWNQMCFMFAQTKQQLTLAGQPALSLLHPQYLCTAKPLCLMLAFKGV